MVLKLKEVYKIWQHSLNHFPKSHRYTLGSRIDDLFLTSIEYCFLASYSPIGEKIPIIDKAISRVDLIKLLLQLGFEIKALDTKKYIHLGESLYDIGKMLGGWKKQLVQKKTLESKTQEKK